MKTVATLNQPAPPRAGLWVTYRHGRYFVESLPSAMVKVFVPLGGLPSFDEAFRLRHQMLEHMGAV
jgi:hypothetical protein